jgi:hypothetical protein
MSAALTRRKRVIGLVGAAGVAVASTTAALVVPTVAGVARAPGVVHTFPAGFNAEGHDEAVPAMLPAGADNENNNVADYLRYSRQAAALPTTSTKLHWVDKGPFGVDMPPGYSQSGERFARVAGMGSAVEVAPGTGGKTVYIGNFGGLWKSTDAGKHWRNLTDGKIPRVAVGAIGLDPNHPKDIYVGTGISYLTLSGDANGTGIYVSHNGGRTFFRAKQHTTGYGSNAIAVTPKAVFVATNRGLFRSTNRGRSFRHIALPTGGHGKEAKGVVANWISDVVTKPGDPNEVTAAVGFGLGKLELPDGSIASPGNGLYRSTKGGAAGTFTKMASTSQLTQPAASSDPIGRIELAYGQAKGDTNTLWAAVSDAGLAAGKQPAGLDVVSATGQSLNRTNTAFNGLYRSGDDGKSFSVKATPQTLETSANSLLALFGPLGYGIGVQAFYNLWVTTDPKVPNQVYLGLEEVFQGAPVGSPSLPYHFQTIERYADLCGFLTYFQNITNGASCPDETPLLGGMSTHPDQHAAAVVATKSGSRIYTGNDGGFFRQDSHVLGANGVVPTQVGFDNQHWKATNSLSTTEPWDVAIKPDGEILAALQDNGSVLVKKNGRGIEICGGDGVFVLPTPNPDVWYCDTPGAVVYYTKDHGHNITAIPPGDVGASGMAGANFTSPVAIDPTDPSHLVAAAQDIDETTKGTNTKVTYDSAATLTILSTDWKKVFNAGDSPKTVPQSTTKYPYTATALAVRGPTVYAADCGACRGAFTPPKLLKSVIVTNSKAGCKAKKADPACWHIAKSKGLPHGWVSGIAIDPRHPRTIYATIGQENLFEYDTKQTGSAKVLVSHDAGDHFTDITGNLPRTELRGVVWRNGKLIVVGDVGVFTAKAGSKSWSHLGSGLPVGVSVRNVYLDSSGRHLVVSMYGRGVWVLTFPRPATSSSGPGSNGSPKGPKTSTSGQQGEQPGPATTGMSAGVSVVALLLVIGAMAVWRRRTL